MPAFNLIFFFYPKELFTHVNNFRVTFVYLAVIHVFNFKINVTLNNAQTRPDVKPVFIDLNTH